MAARITLYGKPTDPQIKRLKREMNAMYVEYTESDLDKDARAKARLQDALGDTLHLPLVEIERTDGDGNLYLSNPDEPTLRHSFYSEGILGITSYWV